MLRLWSVLFFHGNEKRCNDRVNSMYHSFPLLNHRIIFFTSLKILDKLYSIMHWVYLFYPIIKIQQYRISDEHLMQHSSSFALLTIVDIIRNRHVKFAHVRSGAPRWNTFFSQHDTRREWTRQDRGQVKAPRDSNCGYKAAVGFLVLFRAYTD